MAASRSAVKRVICEFRHLARVLRRLNGDVSLWLRSESRLFRLAPARSAPAAESGAMHGDTLPSEGLGLISRTRTGVDHLGGSPLILETTRGATPFPLSLARQRDDTVGSRTCMAPILLVTRVHAL